MKRKKHAERKDAEVIEDLKREAPEALKASIDFDEAMTQIARAPGDPSLQPERDVHRRVRHSR